MCHVEESVIARMSKEKRIKDDQISRSFVQKILSVKDLTPLSYLVHASVDHEIKRAYEQRREKLQELKRSRRRGSKELKRLTDEMNSLLEGVGLGERVNTIGKGEESNMIQETRSARRRLIQELQHIIEKINFMQEMTKLNSVDDTNTRIDAKDDSFAGKDKIIEDVDLITNPSTDEIARSLPFQDSELISHDGALYKSCLLSEKSSTISTLSIDQIIKSIERRRQRRLELEGLTTLGKRGLPCLSLDTSKTNSTFSIEEIRNRIERRRQRRLELQLKTQNLTKIFVDLGAQY